MDTLTPAERSKRMGKVKGRDTRPELVVRSITHRLGYRYRLYGGRLPGKPDLVFNSRRKVIFVHGCFWHRHGDPTCKLARLPKSRLEFWGPKLEANRARDERALARLAELGWDSLVIWECGLRDEASLRARIASFLDS